MRAIVACAWLCLVTLAGLAVDEQRVRDGGLSREQAIQHFRDATRPHSVVRVVRTSTTEVDRRRFERHDVRLTAARLGQLIARSVGHLAA